MTAALDAADRALIARLQDGIAVEDRPFAPIADALGLTEADLLDRVRRLLGVGALTRFGPMFDAERMGGAFVLAALAAPAEDFERVADRVNAHPEVAHNYARDHALNMWFVVAAASEARAGAVLDTIESETGLAVVRLPKLAEYFVGFRIQP